MQLYQINQHQAKHSTTAFVRYSYVIIYQSYAHYAPGMWFLLHWSLVLWSNEKAEVARCLNIFFLLMPIFTCNMTTTKGAALLWPPTSALWYAFHDPPPTHDGYSIYGNGRNVSLIKNNAYRFSNNIFMYLHTKFI